MPDPRDLAHEAQCRAKQLAVVADYVSGPRRHVVAEAATLLREMASERERLRGALNPFAELADTWTVQTAALSGSLLTLSNGERMCGIEAKAFTTARAALEQADD